ncbi:FecCD family ABC transporter permease [Paenibacillus sp. MMS18-CY102]|uniref:FecCD family ABC transporter permease n=1 Tax=Paenibacillus sp. MMS18-CY102 TaxID=2682849 RepID=UPI0013651C3F|nr:iron ABC transporter permease [Paenibacillus sp. MMS18-CY102]MWC31341.1 iron chelate uptake ABC transporter family permease subunit [Paenibacillus sp. MMS18-CY102]
MLRAETPKFYLVLVTALMLLLAAVYVSLTNGTYDISVRDVIKTFLRLDPVREFDLVIFEFRLPRIVLGVMVGFALGLAGSVIQGVTRNPLSEPGILGINAGAGMAVVLFMLVFQGQIDVSGWASVLLMPMFGIAGGLAATAMIFIFARHQGSLDPQRVILVGIAVATGFGSLSMYISLKMNPNDFEMATVWLAGSIYNANWQYIVMMLPWLILLPPIIWARSKVLDLFQLDELNVRGLGVKVERERNWLLVCSIGLVSVSVAVSGSIAFIGLIAPHMARRLVGLRHQLNLPISGLLGSLMIVVADFIGRTVFAPAELAVGIVVSIIGVPYFVYLLIISKR